MFLGLPKASHLIGLTRANASTSSSQITQPLPTTSTSSLLGFSGKISAIKKRFTN
jgi:hypothetical protein